MNTRFNGDTGNNYAIRYSFNNGAEATNASTNTMPSGSCANGGIALSIMQIVNVANKEKIAYYQETMTNTAGAATPAERYEIVGKWANTSSQITQVTGHASANNLAAGSEIIVLGHD